MVRKRANTPQSPPRRRGYRFILPVVNAAASDESVEMASAEYLGGSTDVGPQWQILAMESHPSYACEFPPDNLELTPLLPVHY
jgi:hypothetical protein